MISIHETESVSPEPVRPLGPIPSRRDEEPSESLPELPPVEPDTGKILDTYA